MADDVALVDEFFHSGACSGDAVGGVFSEVFFVELPVVGFREHNSEQGFGFE